MRKRIALIATAAMMALTMSFGGAAAAFAAQPEGGQPGNQEGGPGLQGGGNQGGGQNQGGGNVGGGGQP